MLHLHCNPWKVYEQGFHFKAPVVTLVFLVFKAAVQTNRTMLGHNLWVVITV